MSIIQCLFNFLVFAPKMSEDTQAQHLVILALSSSGKNVLPSIYKS